jgi:endoglucanase
MSRTAVPPGAGFEPARPPGPRRGARRRMLTAAIAFLMVAAGITALSLDGSRSRSVPSRRNVSAAQQAHIEATTFLTRYVAADGRVVRRDQGGDTVSEGQGYALLLSVAIGDRSDFARVWHWEAGHLQEPSSLFASHWSHGRVVDLQPATDADLQTAWALWLGSQKFDDPSYRTAALEVASAILAHETAEVAGRPELVAGPWAAVTPAVVDPSYLTTEAMDALGTASRNLEWLILAADSTALLQSLSSGGAAALPSNWVTISATGSATAVGTPSGAGTPAYGLDAERVPIWSAAGCTAGVRAQAARNWTVLSHTDGQGAHLTYSLSGRATSTQVNPVGLVAAAAAARAAGHARASARLLERAEATSRAHHTYYGDAWVALGRVLLDTHWLKSCAPAGDPVRHGQAAALQSPRTLGTS